MIIYSVLTMHIKEKNGITTSKQTLAKTFWRLLKTKREIKERENKKENKEMLAWKSLKITLTNGLTQLIVDNYNLFSYVLPNKDQNICNTITRT